MSDPIQKAIETQLANIQSKTGKTLAELAQFAQASGLAKHGQIRDLFKQELGLGHGDANTLTHYVLQSSSAFALETEQAPTDELLDQLYSGPKAALRPIHDKLMAAITQFGDFDISPKQKYVSLRRKKQFAMLGPATNKKVELGLNVKELQNAERLTSLPAGNMCNYKIRLSDSSEVDEQLVEWVRQAYESAG